MAFPEISPYEVLGIAQDTPRSELMAAYQRAVKARRHPTAQLTQAFNELRNVRKRAEHDLLTHAAPANASAAVSLLAELPPPAFVTLDQEPPPLALGVAPGHLARAYVEQEHCPVPDYPIQLAATDAYRQTAGLLPPIDLPA
jgi:hypothetical protein